MKKQDDPLKTYPAIREKEKGGGPNSAGQSGDSQGLSDVALGGSESVQELVEEGQYREAAIQQGVEDAESSEVEEVHTRQFPEDDVPEEYLNEDEGRP